MILSSRITYLINIFVFDISQIPSECNQICVSAVQLFVLAGYEPAFDPKQTLQFCGIDSY
jgi:hypothetical protein